MKIKLVCLCVSVFVVAAAMPVVARAADQWEKEIRNFEERDKQQPPPKDAILFVGSSTIRIWDLKKSFPDLVTINRGFGGSQYADSARYAGRIIIPYHPKAIVMYAGDNDIDSGKTPDQVFAEFQTLIAKIRKGLPDARILVLSIKPCPARWAKYDKMKQFNEKVQGAAKADSHIQYVDVGKCVFGEDGKPRADLFKKDGLHLNEQAYAMWAEILKPLL